MSFYGKASPDLAAGGGGGSGTVTSVAFTATPSSVFDVSGSPITTSGTIALSMDNQTGNTVLASPSDGSSGQPSFRALVASDIPTLPLTSAHIFVGNGSNLAADVAVSGDISITNAGVTAYSGTVPNTKGGTGGNSSASTGIAHVSSGTWSYSSIVNADVSTSAAIAYSKLAALTSAHILVGNGSNVATDVAMTGDVTISNAGVTAIGAGKVTNTMLAGSIATSKISLTAPTVQRFTSDSATYTTPAGVLYIKVKMVGGGGGGGASANGNGGAGGDSTFGTSLLTAGGGAGGAQGSSVTSGAAGGTNTINSPAVVIINSIGGGGGASADAVSGNKVASGIGGNSALAGAGKGISGSAAGAAGGTNTGGGGSGGSGGASGQQGSGGGGGGYIEAIITSPSASYSYAVGVGGSAGHSTGNDGGAGGSGLIVVEEYYQ